jgi:hypothetical protein
LWFYQQKVRFLSNIDSRFLDDFSILDAQKHLSKNSVENTSTVDQTGVDENTVDHMMEDGTTLPEWMMSLRLKKSKTFSDLFHDSFNTKERRRKLSNEDNLSTLSNFDDQLILY